MTNFWAKSPPFTGSDRTTPRGRFRISTSPFLRGTCWAFHSGRHCRGYQYEHVCFKCGAKHPATQCQNQSSQLRANPVKSTWALTLARVSGQFPGKSRKSGMVWTAPCGLRPNPKTTFNQRFPFGFRINFIREITSFEALNLKSALQNLEILFSELSKELDARRIAGLFFRTSPVGIVPEKVPNEFRLIHHLSYLKGLSVNGSIPDNCSSVWIA